MSHWSLPKDNDNSELFLDMWKVSCALAKKHYGKVFLVTDTPGRETLKILPFDEIIVALDGIPQIPHMWCAGKLYAYKYAAMYGQFLHLDADVFLWEKLPEDLTNSDIFAQNIEDDYLLNNVYKKFPGDYEAPSLINTIIENKMEYLPYNVGIFGGTNVEQIEKYVDIALDLFEDPQWYHYFNNESGKSNRFTKSCLLEQGVLGYCRAKYNWNVECLYEENDKNNKTYLKYTHLVSAKNFPEIKAKIAERVKTGPYDLTPKKTGLYEWSSRDEE